MAGAARISHVIFDMDGLLLNTEQLYTECYTRVCARYGKTYTWDTKIKCMGKKSTEAAKTIIDDLDLPLTVEDWMKEANEQTARVFHTAELMPGAERLVRHLHQHSVPICVASGSAKASYDIKATNHQEFFSLFEHILCSGSDPEVTNGKPHPLIFQLAARRFKGETPKPENVLVFEDAVNGVEAGRAANMFVVAVPDEHIRKLVVDKAHQTLSSLEEFRPEEWGLPAYEK